MSCVTKVLTMTLNLSKSEYEMFELMGSLPNLSVIKGPTVYHKPNLLHRIFEEVAANNEDKIALLYEDGDNVKTYTYKELNELSNQLARAICFTISKNNLPRNSDGDYIVAVCMDPSDNLMVTLLGIWKAGAAYLPLDTSFPKPRIEHIITEAKPAIVIYDSDFADFSGSHPITFSSLLHQAADFNNKNLRDGDCLEQTKDDIAIVLYTSGSTGTPKGVRVPHKAIQNRLQWQFRTFPYGSTEKVGVFKTALTFVDSVQEIWGPLLSGLAVLVVRKAITQDPEKLVSLLEKYKIERLVLVPSLLRSLLMYLELQKRSGILSNLRLWICSGETLVVPLVKKFYQYFSENQYRLCNFYGSTEIMGDVTYYIINGTQQLRNMEKVPIGVPIDNTIIYILNEDLRPVKTGDVGELFASGQNLACGYVNGKAPEKFIQNPLAIDPAYAKLYRTGDYTKVEKEMIIYEGRTDSQIKIRGHRVDLTEVEKAVNSIEEVQKGVVLCYMPGEMDQALLAYVTTQALITENYLESILRRNLTDYMVPQVIFVETIPLLVNGKIDRQSLLKRYETVNNNDDVSFQVEISYSDVPLEKMDEAKILFETVASVLNRSARAAVSMEVNFYDIGGNSLNSIYTITKLSEAGYHIGISEFIAAPNLGEVLNNMRNTKDTESNTQHTYTAELLREEHKADVLDMITTSFHQKADLEQLLMPGIFEEDYTELINALWEPLLERNLSFIAKNKDGEIHGVAMNFDAREEPEVEITSKLTIVFEFLESIEGPVRDNVLPPGKGVALHSFMMGTRSVLTPQENISIMNFMEEEVLRLATERKFTGIFTTNTSPLTQQLGSDVYGYETLLDCQINQYVASDNTKPFGMALDSQRVLLQWKPII